jgi:hypothetical protein
MAHVANIVGKDGRAEAGRERETAILASGSIVRAYTWLCGGRYGCFRHQQKGKSNKGRCGKTSGSNAISEEFSHERSFHFGSYAEAIAAGSVSK